MESTIELIMSKTNLNYIEAKVLAEDIIDTLSTKLVPHFVKLTEHSSDSANKRKVIMAKERIKTIISEE